MLSWLMIISAVIFMAKAAEMEHRSSLKWGAYTLAWCVAFTNLLPDLPFINIVLGFVVSFGSMFAANILKQKK